MERFSTCLSEQRTKAREIVQTFAQLIDFAQTGVKKPWWKFDPHPALRAFDRHFETSCLDRFLYQVGFTEPHRRVLLNKHRREAEAFFELHAEFERVKTHRKRRKVADGVHRPAIFNMRMALSHMAEYIDGLPVGLIPPVAPDEFFAWILSSQAMGRDRRLPSPACAARSRRGRNIIYASCKKFSRLPPGIETSVYCANAAR